MEMKNVFEAIHITNKMTGKMSGFQSISTCCVCNPRCLERIKNEESICNYCYAFAQMKRYKNMIDCLSKNAKLLSSSILPDYQLPSINTLYFRFEAFGDLINATHCINYFNICKKNPMTTFALWTKNPDFIKQAIDGGNQKPDNLIIILSSMILNKPATCNYDFVDKIFTVYDKKFAKENNVEINCGARKCLECLQCYKKNGIKNIKEQLK